MDHSNTEELVYYTFGKAAWHIARGSRVGTFDGPVARVLAALPRISSNPFVIVGDKENRHLVNLQKPWSRIRRRAGLENVRIHDLRHTFVSVAARRGASLPIMGRLVGHTQAQTTQRYAHLVPDAVREFGEATISEIESLILPSGE